MLVIRSSNRLMISTSVDTSRCCSTVLSVRTFRVVPQRARPERESISPNGGPAQGWDRSLSSRTLLRREGAALSQPGALRSAAPGCFRTPWLKPRMGGTRTGNSCRPFRAKRLLAEGIVESVKGEMRGPPFGECPITSVRRLHPVALADAAG